MTEDTVRNDKNRTGFPGTISRMFRSKLFLYALFAGISIGGNFLTQKLTLLIYSGRFSIFAALITGTGTGLFVKYLLDKRFIFRYKTENKSEDLGKFILYSLMGVVTTAIFWGSELLFNYLFTGENMKFLGGLIGLIIGYTVKYFLDRQFVFIKREGKE